MAAAALIGLGAPLAQSQMAHAQTASAQTRTQEFAQLPYWPGYWVSAHQAGTTIGGIAPETLQARETGQAVSPDFMSLFGFDAPWNAEGQRRFAEARKAAAGRKAMGWGFPMMMNAAAPLQFLISPEEVLIINPYGDVRHVYTDGRAMPAPDDMWPTVWGTSVGHWENDVLVVETIGVRDPTFYFHGAPPLSEAARYVERLTLNGDRLEAQITIEDPVTLEKAWTVQLGWVRDDGFDRMIHIDFDNDRTGFDGEFNTIEMPQEGE